MSAEEPNKNNNDKNSDALEEAFDISIENIAKSALEDKEKKEEVKAKKEEQRQKAQEVVLTLKGKYDIFPYDEIEFFSFDDFKAYKATDPNDGSKSLIAVTCHEYWPPRRRFFRTFDSINNKCIANLVDYGVVQWRHENKERYVLIYDNIFGKPAMTDLAKKHEPFSEDMLVEKLIKPMSEIITDFAERDFIHGGINPLNLFDNMLDNGNSFALRPCMEMPLSYAQPAIFEPIEVALSPGYARGHGHKKNDIYSFGVTVVMLMIGYNPLVGKSDDEVIDAKIKQGSYAALVGKHRIPAGINEVLRGCLSDDIDSRWGYQDLAKWADGKRMTPKQSPADQRYDRGFPFNGRDYHHLRSLAKAMWSHPAEVIRVLEDDSLHKWLDRTLGEKKVAERLVMAKRQTPGDMSDKKNRDLLTTRVIMALDPKGPIRYRHLAFNPEGLGNVLLHCIAEEQDINDIMTVIAQDLIQFWFSFNPDNYADVATMVSNLDSCKRFLKQRVKGNGIERCLYFLNRDASCQSETFKNYHVHNALGVMFVLNKIGMLDNHPREPFDQHMAAFLTVHFSSSNEGDIQLLGAEDLKERYYATLTLLASLQRFGEAKSLKGLGRWVMGLMGPVIESFHSRKIQKKIEKELQKSAAKGDLVGMYEVVNNQTINREDFLGFSKAQIEYKRLAKEYQRLSTELKSDTMGQAQGLYLASVIAFCMAILGLGVFLAIHYNFL